MKASIKSEFRKLLTVRSTYLMCGLALALLALMTFYFEGYRGITGSGASELAPTALNEIVTNGAGIIATFLTIIAILLMAHEYRYNTIMYTLTANTHRTKVLLAKATVMVIFSIVFGLLAILFALGSYFLGLNLRDAALPAQDFDVLYQFGRGAVYLALYSLVGLSLATVLRSVVGAIAFFFIVPVTVEPLLGLLLKENVVYLPFSALDSIMGLMMRQEPLSTLAAIGVSGIYVITGSIVAWILFLRRDAVQD